MECLATNGAAVSASCVVSLAPETQNHEKGSGKIVRTRRQGRLERSNVFWTWWNHCTQELTEAVVVCTRPACGQASQCPSVEHGWSRKASYCSSVEQGWSCRLPSLAKTLLTAGGFLGRENQSSLRV